MTDEEITLKLKQIRKQFIDNMDRLDLVSDSQELRISNLETTIKDVLDLMLEDTDQADFSGMEMKP